MSLATEYRQAVDTDTDKPMSLIGFIFLLFMIAIAGLAFAAGHDIANLWTRMKGHTAVVILCAAPLGVLATLLILAALGIEPLSRANLP